MTAQTVELALRACSELHHARGPRCEHLAVVEEHPQRGVRLKRQRRQAQQRCRNLSARTQWSVGRMYLDKCHV